MRPLIWVSKSMDKLAEALTAMAITAEMEALNITGDDFHPEWNYTIDPRPPQAPA